MWLNDVNFKLLTPLFINITMEENKEGLLSFKLNE